MIDIANIAVLRDRVGQELAVSEWIEVTQQRIDQFAEATDDHQWIHVDPTRAAASSPFKTTIAHGFLTLSLISALLRNAVTLGGVRLTINYGVNRVRFVAPVPPGARIRGRFTLATVEDAEAGRAVQVTWSVVIEREHGAKPCCVVDWVVRYYPEAGA
ncbi:MAG: MaoC family dehydratase [Acidobacteria bacterium]|nr:MaoC family dehydratase [Acidobacteriota bacterium]